jgi:hypothetical protein
MDNGGELCINEFKEFCKKCGIVNQNTNPYTHQHNGVSQRMNMMLMEKARCMLSCARLGHECLVETVGSACYPINRSHSSMLDGKTPHSVWTSKKSSLTHIRVFGCDSYAHVLNENKSKIDINDEKCIFIGYKDGMKCYNLWNSRNKRVVYNQDYLFIEIKDVVK